MQLLLSGEMVNTVESFTDILKTEEALDGNLTYLLQDLIAVAVQEGNNKYLLKVMSF